MPHVVLPRRALILAPSLLLVAGLAACAGTVTVASSSTAPVATAGPGAPATVPTPAATLAGAGGTTGAPPLTGTAVPGSDLAEHIRTALGSARSVTMTLTTADGGGTATVDLAHRSLRLRTGGAQPVTLVHVGSSTWVQGAGSVTTTSTPTGSSRATRSTREWLQLREDRSDVLSRRLGAAADVESLLRPDAFVGMLDGLLGDQSPVDGGTRTSFRVPPAAYVAAVRGGPDLAASLTQPVDLVVELDAQSRPTRLTATLTSGTSTVVDDTRYSGWGDPVTIGAPDPADVALAPLPTGSGAGEEPTGEPTPSSTRTRRRTSTSTSTSTGTGDSTSTITDDSTSTRTGTRTETGARTARPTSSGTAEG